MTTRNSKRAGVLSLAIAAVLMGGGVQAQQAEEGSEQTQAVGLLTGRVLARGSDAPIAGVLVTAQGAGEPRYTRTDADGEYLIELPAGSWQIELSHPRYGDQTIPDVAVAANATQQADFSLGRTGPQLEIAAPMEEVTVTGTYVAGGADQERFSANVMDVIGREDFSVTGDSSAVDALKRVTGLTVVNDKYVYVRGLGERYSNTTLNGAALPSPDPTRRVIPLDLFPTGVLETVEIQKTYSPDLPGDFSGGMVRMRTREIPQEPVLTISGTVKGNSETTGQDALVFQPGDRDWSGYDDGVRDLPGTINSLTQGGTVSLTSLTPEQQQQAGRSINRSFDSEFVEDPVSFDGELNWSDRFETGAGGLGLLVATRFANEWNYREEERRTFGISQGQLFDRDVGRQARNVNTVDLSTIFNVEWDLNDANTLRSTTFYTHSTDNTTVREFRFLAENDIDVADTTYEWVERQLVTQQLSGNHYFADLGEFEVDWHATWSKAKREEPNTVFYRYEQLDNGLYQFSDSGQSNEFSWEDLDDEALNAGVDLRLPVRFTDNIETTFAVGGAWLDKDRDSEFRRFRYLTDFSQSGLRPVLDFAPDVVFADENIAPDLWELVEQTQPTDNYTAEEDVLAGYVMADTEFGDHWRLMLGARYEDAEQRVTTFELANPDQAVVGELTEQDVLPALTGTWIIDDAHQVRLGYSRTLNRPDLKELSEAPYIDAEERYTVIGNPALQLAKIDNYDLRWEWYWTSIDSLQVAVFYKELDTPIERVIRLGAGDIRTFANAESATSQGVEVSVNSSLEFIGEAFADLWVRFNGALIDSEVDIGNAGAQQTTNNRELQGQSPWVANLQFGYDNPFRDIQLTLAYNIFGERITDVGTQGLPDAYEQPAGTLDLVYRHGIELFGQQFRLKARAQNLLDPDYEVERGDRIERKYNRGVYWSVGFDWIFE